MYVCVSASEATNNSSHEINQLVALYGIVVMDECGPSNKELCDHLPKEEDVKL